MKTLSNKDSSKTSTASSNASQLDEILDNFFQANKFQAAKRPNALSQQPHLDKFKSKSFEKSDGSSQSQYTQGISKQPNFASSQKDLKISEKTVVSSNQKDAPNYFDSSSDDENIIEQFKPYSSTFYKSKVTTATTSNTFTHTHNFQNKNNLLCTQSQDSNTPVLSDIRCASSNLESQGNELPLQQFNSRQNSLQDASQNYNNLNSFQRQNSLQLNSHNSCELQQSKSSKNNLISSSICANNQKDSQDKSTVGKDSVEKSNWSDSSKKKGLTYLNSYQEKQIKNQNENQRLQSNQSRCGPNHIQSMNQFINKCRAENLANMRNDAFQSSSLTTLGDRSNKSSLSKINEDQSHEDENLQSNFSEYDSHPYEQRLKNSASVSISKNQQIKSQSQSYLPQKNIFNQNQTKPFTINQNESFGFESGNYFSNNNSNNNLIQNKSNQINFGNNSQGSNQYFLDKSKFFSTEKEQFKKYESLYSSQNKQSSNQMEESNSLFNENQQPKKFSLKKISPIQKFSTQPINNTYLQSKNNSCDKQNFNDDDEDDDSDLEYLKKIAQNSQNNMKKQLGSTSQQAFNKQSELTLFKSKSTPSPQSSASLTNILNKFKCNKQHQLQVLKQSTQNYNSQFKNKQEKTKLSKIFDDEEEEDFSEFSKSQVDKKNQKNNISQNANKNKQQKKKTNNLNSKRRRLIQEEDYSDEDEYDSVNQFFEEEAKSDGVGDDYYDEDDDFIDNSKKNNKNHNRQKKKNQMRNFDDESEDERFDDNDDDGYQNINRCRNQLKKKRCLEGYDDENDFDGFQGRKEKSIYLTETKKKSKEEQKQKMNKENRKRIIDSDQSDSEKMISSSDKKMRSSSKKKSKNKKYDFSESDGAVDVNDDYEVDSFIDDDDCQSDLYEQEEDQLNLHSPSNEEADENASDKIFLSIADQKGNRKKKKLIKGANLGQIEHFKCSVCQDYPSQSYFGEINCFHRFCFDCIQNWSEVANICPECRQEFTQIVKRNFDGTINNSKPIKVRRKRQKVNEEDYIQEAQALQDQEDLAALGEVAEEEPVNVEPSFCYKCFKSDKENLLLICDVCDENYCHTFCDEKINSNRVPTDRWACHFCRY